LRIINVLLPNLECDKVPANIGALSHYGHRYLVAASPPLKMPATQWRRAILVVIATSLNSHAVTQYAVWWQNLEDITVPRDPEKLDHEGKYSSVLDPSVNTYHGSYFEQFEDAFIEFNMRCEQQLREYINCKGRVAEPGPDKSGKPA